MFFIIRGDRIIPDLLKPQKRERERDVAGAAAPKNGAAAPKNGGGGDENARCGGGGIPRVQRSYAAAASTAH